MIRKIKGFFIQCVRVWHTTKKPDINEIKLVSKASAIGVGIVGFIGFLIYILFSMIK